MENRADQLDITSACGFDSRGVGEMAGRRAACGAFRAATARRICGASRDIPRARIGEMPYIQHFDFGAVIASNWSGDSGESPTSRPRVASRPALMRSLLLIVAAMRGAGRFATGVTPEDRKSKWAVISLPLKFV